MTPREELVRYFNSHPDQRRKETAGAPRDDDDDNAGEEVHAWFRHKLGETSFSTLYYEMSAREWDERIVNADETAWAVSRLGDVVRAIQVSTESGTAKAYPPPAQLEAESPRIREIGDPEAEHMETWMYYGKRAPVHVIWFITTPAKWKRDERSNGDSWLARKIGPRKLLVIGTKG